MARLYARFEALLTSPRAPLACVLFGVVLALPSLGYGINADDHWHALAFHEENLAWHLMEPSWWNLFTFFTGDPVRCRDMIDVGLYPWWTDPEAKAIFFRPLASATHALDYVLWPKAQWLMHAQSIAWYAALIAVAGWTYRRLFARHGKTIFAANLHGQGAPPPDTPERRLVSLRASRSANLATLVYALDYTHGMPVGWLANRNGVLTGIFALASFGVYDVAATKTRPLRWLVLSALLLVLGLLAGEAALAATAFMAAHAMFLDDRPMRARLASLAPAAAAVVVWFIPYRLGGFGVKASGLYVEPLREPIAYAASVLQSMPLLVASELGGASPDLYAFLPWTLKAVMLAVALSFLAWASMTILRIVRGDRLAKMLLVGSLLATLPACATFPATRLLVIPSFGLVAFSALALVGVVENAAWIPVTGIRRKLVRSYAWWTGVGHIVLSPLVMQVTMVQIPLMTKIVHRFARDLPQGEPPERLVVVNSPDALFIAFLLVEAEPGSKPYSGRMLTLAGGQRDLHITREDDRTLLVEQAGGFYRSGTELIPRKAGTPMPVGTRIEVTGLAIEVLHALPDGVADRARFRFDGPLEDARRIVFLEWKGPNLVPFTPPPVGSTTTIAGQLPQLR